MTCSPCQPGYYKAAVATDPCAPCPANTYVEVSGSSALSSCLSCQARSSTSAGGQSSRRACACEKEYYLITSNPGTPAETLSCQTCPKGAVCGGDGECALRNAGANFTCTDGTSSIVGTWILDSSTGQYKLTSCPAGYEMKTTAESSADLQECFKCPSPSTYILRPDVDECQVCPPGLSCSGDARLAPKIEGSVWVEHGSFWKLDSCPAGYYVSPAGLVTLTAATAQQQQCLPCEKGYECVTASCVTCTACAPGFYKAAVSTETCSPCPANTYVETVGSSALSLCQVCQPKSSTLQKTGQSFRQACVCDMDYYLIISRKGTPDEVLSCQVCPRGAVCGDGECALRNTDNFTCTDGKSSIVGTWILDNMNIQYPIVTERPISSSFQHLTNVTQNSSLNFNYLLYVRTSYLSWLRPVCPPPPVIV